MQYNILIAIPVISCRTSPYKKILLPTSTQQEGINEWKHNAMVFSNPCRLARKYRRFEETYCPIFSPEERICMFLWNSCIYALFHIVLLPRRQTSVTSVFSHQISYNQWNSIGTSYANWWDVPPTTDSDRIQLTTFLTLKSVVSIPRK
jgi:hypothetical protein